jgi:hypothetical protein
MKIQPFRAYQAINTIIINIISAKRV